MARERGTFNFSANLEVKKQGALDSRLVVQTYAELVLAATWADSDNKVWLYDGMIVSVIADNTGKNGVYKLDNKDNYTSSSSWTRIDAGAATNVEVIDNLESESSIAALSAKQGKVLKEEIDSHINNEDIHLSDDERDKLESIEEGAEVNVQSDWNETNSNSDAFIKNKPTIYSKPSTGIPKSDLNEYVLTSLNKAETALQEEQYKGTITVVDADNSIDAPEIPETSITEQTIADWGFTKNEGTITEIIMNGESKGNNGVIDLGNVVTEHLDISGKADKITENKTIVSYTDSGTLLPNCLNKVNVVKSTFYGYLPRVDDNGNLNEYMIRITNYYNNDIPIYLYDNATHKEINIVNKTDLRLFKLYEISVLDNLALMIETGDAKELETNTITFSSAKGDTLYQYILTALYPVESEFTVLINRRSLSYGSPANMYIKFNVGDTVKEGYYSISSYTAPSITDGNCHVDDVYLYKIVKQ